MDKRGKLELTWVGKYEEEKLEPRILIEDKSKSYGDENAENMLIHGDNLLALKALERDCTGKIKCIYIDPPYNTGAAFEHYDDEVEHSIWLSLMRQRLMILKNLLRDDGYIFVQIDDNEQAYLTVLMDEVFGRQNHINTICINMNSLSGVKMTHVINGKRFPAQKEYILLYKKGITFSPLKIEKLHKGSWDKEYNLIIPEMTQEFFDKIPEMEDAEINDCLKKMSLLSLAEYASSNEILLTDEWKWENAYRIFGSKSNRPLAKRVNENIYEQQILCYTNQDGNKRFFRTDFNREAKDPRIELVQAEANSSVFVSDNWTDISNDGGVAQEGGVTFPKGKKPEKIIERVIKCSTDAGDYVLDSFLGSGTTAAVAHKMGRRWIGIEMGEQIYSHCQKRLERVINGEDNAGITNIYNWQGGGGYKFYELAEPLLVKNPVLPVYQINPSYTWEMVCEAICKIEGFTYAPAGEFQGYSSENRFIHITEEFVNTKYIMSVMKTLGERQSLLIYCKKNQADMILPENVEVKKIPKDLLEKCTFESEV